MKTQNYLLAVLLLCIVSSHLNAQTSPRLFLGVGAGLDYGGLGLRAEYQPIDQLGVWGGAGYNLVDPVFNVGVNCKLQTKTRARPLITAMYGYNVAVRVPEEPGRPDLSSTYSGFTIGGGCEYSVGSRKNKLLMEVLVPFRSANFRQYHRLLKSLGYELEPAQMPVTVTIGYNFSLARRL